MLEGTRKRHFLILFCLAIFIASSLFYYPVTKAAACPSSDGGYGSVLGSVSIPSTGSYRVWSRIKANTTAGVNNNSYWLIIDGTTCYVVGDNHTAIPDNQWVWVDWQDAAMTSKINHTFTSTGNHTVKMLGREANVQLDRVLFTTDTTSAACNPPTGTGDTCAVNSSPVTPIPTPNSGGTSIGSGSTTTTGGGSVTLPTVPGAAPVTISGGEKGTVSNEVTNVPKVSGTIAFKVDTPVPGSSVAANVTVVDTKIYDSRSNLLAHGNGKLAVDTTNLLDGVQTLKIVTKTSDGKTTTQKITLEVHNFSGLWQHTWYTITTPWRKLTQGVGL